MTDASRPRIVIAGGGTGGHLFPGLATGETLRGRGYDVRFVGTANGIEVRAVPAAGYPLDLVAGRQVRGGGPLRVVQGLAALAAGVRESRALLSRLRPVLVVGVGGYASVATVVAAWLRGIPTVLLEQNTVPGFASRLLGRLVRRVCLGFAEAARFFPPGRAVHTGNPVRASVLVGGPAAIRERTGLLVFGGSQGARRINEAAVDAVGLLGPAAAQLAIVHQTGVADRDAVAARWAALGLAVDVHAFIADMGAAYGAADVVVARSGAMSCAEITARGLPAILVPYPHAADDHQRHNAEALVRASAAEMLLDRDCDGARLHAALAPLLADPVRRGRMAAASRALGRPDAAERVVEQCLALLAP